eukprot:353797-Chlamydomonas_euryale.AAC.2
MQRSARAAAAMHGSGSGAGINSLEYIAAVTAHAAAKATAAAGGAPCWSGREPGSDLFGVPQLWIASSGSTVASSNRQCNARAVAEFRGRADSFGPCQATSGWSDAGTDWIGIWVGRWGPARDHARERVRGPLRPARALATTTINSARRGELYCQRLDGGKCRPRGRRARAVGPTHPPLTTAAYGAAPGRCAPRWRRRQPPPSSPRRPPPAAAAAVDAAAPDDLCKYVRASAARCVKGAGAGLANKSEHACPSARLPARFTRSYYRSRTMQYYIQYHWRPPPSLGPAAHASSQPVTAAPRAPPPLSPLPPPPRRVATQARLPIALLDTPPPSFPTGAAADTTASSEAAAAGTTVAAARCASCTAHAAPRPAACASRAEDGSRGLRLGAGVFRAGGTALAGDPAHAAFVAPGGCPARPQPALKIARGSCLQGPRAHAQ